MSLNAMDENSEESVSKVRFVPERKGLIAHFERPRGIASLGAPRQTPLAGC
jgi:hypothetical protein